MRIVIYVIFDIIDFSINGLNTENCLRSQRTHKTVQNLSKELLIDEFGDKNRVNSSNFNATILKFSEKFDHPFSHVLISGNIFSKELLFSCYAGYKLYQRYTFQFIPI